MIPKWIEKSIFEMKFKIDKFFSSSSLLDPVVEYTNAGIEFAQRVKDLPELDYTNDYIEKFEKWRLAESSFTRLGYRSIAFDEFFEANSVKDLSFIVYREKMEEPILHAELYKKHWLRQEQFSHVTDVTYTMYGYFVPPSTQRFIKFDM